MFWTNYFKARRLATGIFEGSGFFSGLRMAEVRRRRAGEKRREEQWKKLLSLLEYTYRNNEYYRSLCDEKRMTLKDIKSFNDMPSMPVVEKEGIRQYFPNESVTKGLQEDRYMKDRTAGSTGNPLFFFRDRASLHSDWVAFALSELDTGWQYGQRVVILKATVPEITWFSSIKVRLGYEPFRMSALDLTPKGLPDAVKKLQKIKPDLLVGYPSASVIIARYCRNSNIELSMPGLLTSGEILSEDDRQFLQETFHGTVHQLYAASECMYIGWECRLKKGYHIDLERFIVETVDGEGIPVREGEEGEILVTNLDNYCMPFIRYRLGDYGSISNDECGCGITGPLITHLHGKIHHVIVTPTGKQVSVHFFGALFRDTGENVDQFQVVQTGKNRLVLLVVPRKDSLDAAIRDALRAKTAAYVEGSMDVEVVETRQIDADPSGKRPMIRKNFGFRVESSSNNPLDNVSV
jgi:phenylacetate-CoA ligase